MENSIEHMNKVYVGIDVGGNGGVFAFTDTGMILIKEAIPQIKGGGGVDYRKLATILKNIKGKAFIDTEITVGIEDVHSLYGMSAKSNFSFGHIKGVKIGMLEILGYDYTLVAPKTWQKLIWKDSDIVLKDTGKGKNTKATSLNAAVRIFPDVDFRKSSRATKPHDGIFDAALIAEYMRLIDNSKE